MFVGFKCFEEGINFVGSCYFVYNGSLGKLGFCCEGSSYFGREKIKVNVGDVVFVVEYLFYFVFVVIVIFY